MGKLLSISIASYNVEKYLNKALDSMIIPGYMEKIEVLIINDGSKDGTEKVAFTYQNKYPDTFKLVNKENGGYGTTVNIGIAMAKGKYFKLLDGDDWFDQNGLIKLIDTLENTDADCVISQMYKVPDGTADLQAGSCNWKELFGKILTVDEIKVPMSPGMWHLTVRTTLLQDHQYLLPGKTLYTDQLFVINVLSRVQSICFIEAPVYCYRVGRDGQSVSKENRVKHISETINVFMRQVDLFVEAKEMSAANRFLVLNRIERYYVFVIKTLLLGMRSADIKKVLVQTEKELKKKSPEIYRYTAKNSRKIKLLRLTNYSAYTLLGGKEENWF